MDDPPYADSDASRRARDRRLFDAIAPRYCRKDLLPASSRARRLRLEQTLRKVPLSPAADVLEVGCGAGFAARYLQGRFRSYVGIDQSQQLIQLATAYNAGDDVAFHCTDITSYEPDRLFDGIFMIGVLHHLPRPEDDLAHIAGWLAPAGWLVVNEPQPANPLFSHARRIRKRLHEDYSAEQEQLSAAQLTTMFAHAGFSDVVVAPQGLFSTPLAEVVLKPQLLARALALPACLLDRVLEAAAAPLLRRLSWNLIAAGRRAPATADE